MIDSRFIVGIDLGTTNTAAFYIDTRETGSRIRPFEIPQTVVASEVKTLPLLPSFCYLPGSHELPKGALKLPWSDQSSIAVGAFARDHGALVPKRLIASAKSWLAHAGVDRNEAILPWHTSDDVQQLSPVDASASYLAHLKSAWNHRFATMKDDSGSPCTLETQQVVITIPASFDETARELTIEAAKRAGLKEISLVEEPMAAFYSWLSKHERSWTEELKPGEKVLVVDVGGGTTDFSMIETDTDNQLHRYAVGEHLLLGGDNIDMAVARKIEADWGNKLDAADWSALCQLCRRAKEDLLSTDKQSVDITLLAKGSSVVQNMKKATVTRIELYAILEDGFIPELPVDADVSVARAGIRRMGLPYADNPAITAHLLQFLRTAAEITNQMSRKAAHGAAAEAPQLPEGATKPPLSYPDRILFNGGTMIPGDVRRRIINVITTWFPDRPEPTELEGEDLSQAVAIGAAYYGRIRRGDGVKVRGGIAKSYYLEIESGGNTRQLICVIARDTEETIQITVPGNFQVRTNQTVRFDLFSSAVRLFDEPGEIITDREEISLVAPVCSVLQFGKATETPIPVQVHASQAENGTLQVELASITTKHCWPLKFDLRPVRDAAVNPDTPTIVVEQALIDESLDQIRTIFSSEPKRLSALMISLESTLGLSRNDWSVPLLRRLFDLVLELAEFRRRSANHEKRWLNLAGFCARPGFGDPEDSLRIRKLWAIWFDGVYHPKDHQVTAEWWILWRRVSPGLKPGHQTVIATSLLKILVPKGEYRQRLKEGDQAKREMWRCLGSLEYIPVSMKSKIGMVLLNRGKKLAASELWVIARLGARRLFHGPENLILPAATVESWINTLSLLVVKQEAITMRQLALTNVAMKTGVRAVDVSESTFDDLQAQLEQEECPARWLEHLVGGLENNSSTVERVIADSLPAGLTYRPD